LQVLVKAANVGAGLIHKGLTPQNSTFVGLYSQNRVEVSCQMIYIDTICCTRNGKYIGIIIVRHTGFEMYDLRMINLI